MTEPHARGPEVVYTVGHSTRSAEAFVDLLRAANVEALVDVRRYPASRRHPWFIRDALAESLASTGIEYVWEGEAMGGRRKPAPDSPQTGLTSPGFRAYADHMGSEAFQRALERLRALAARKRAAVMCAERLPWRCHRWFISDYLTLQGVRVRHVIDERSVREHRAHPNARLAGGQILYTEPQQADRDLGQ